MASRDANGVAAHTAFELHTNLCSHVGQHTPPQLSPSEEGHENSTPDGSTRLQRKAELCECHHWAHAEQNISSLAPYSKTECLTTYTEETSHTTNNLTKQITKQQSCHTPWKNAKNRNPTCVQQ